MDGKINNGLYRNNKPTVPDKPVLLTWDHTQQLHPGQSLRTFTMNYNILRIFAGMANLKYSS